MTKEFLRYSLPTLASIIVVLSFLTLQFTWHDRKYDLALRHTNESTKWVYEIEKLGQNYNYLLSDYCKQGLIDVNYAHNKLNFISKTDSNESVSGLLGFANNGDWREYPETRRDGRLMLAELGLNQANTDLKQELLVSATSLRTLSIPKNLGLTNNKIQLDSRILAFNVDTQMYVDKIYTARLIISGNADSANVLFGINKYSDHKIARTKDLTVYTSDFSIGDSMNARLIDPAGDRFKIDTPETVIQDVNKVKNDLRIWEWHVIPQTSGVNDLFLNIEVINNGKSHPEGPSLRKTITVLIKNSTLAIRVVKYFAGEGKWAVTAIILPFVAWFFTKRSNKSGKTSKKKDGGDDDETDDEADDKTGT